MRRAAKTLLITLTRRSGPVAEFVASPLTPATDDTLSFTDQSTGSPTSWLWEKNSGGGWSAFSAQSTTRNPSATAITLLGGSGIFSVRLTATNASGSNTRTRTDYITVVAP